MIELLLSEIALPSSGKFPAPPFPPRAPSVTHASCIISSLSQTNVLREGLRKSLVSLPGVLGREDFNPRFLASQLKGT